MPSKATKAMIVGIDAPIVPRLIRFAQEGKLPALGKLLQEGVYAANCLSPFPTITPPNWTTIATGAWPGTHGITDYDGHVPGDPLDVVHQNYYADEVKAEHLWRAAERVGKRSILVNYPTSWHASLKDGWQIGGYGLHANDVRLGVPHSQLNVNNICDSILISTEMYPFGSELVLSKAQGWNGVEHGPKALEGSVTLVLRKTLHKVEPITWHVLVDDRNGNGYDTVIVAKAKDKAGVYARLELGKWTENVFDTFQTEAGPKETVFRMKLLELSADASRVKIFVPGLCSLHGWALPAGLEGEIRSEEGIPLVRPPFDALVMEWIDGTTLAEVNDLHNNWLADASEYLMASKPWDLYFTHIHTPDGLYHAISVDLDPLTSRDERLREEMERTELLHYQSVDKLIGRLVAAAGDDTAIVVTSDHGAKAKMHDFSVNEVLEKEGLLAYKPAEEGRPRQIDWSRTKAVGQRSVHVYVNTKGRDPQGIVEPGEEYAKVQQQVVDALHEYVDPKTGLKPIVLALKREDARIIGHYDERSGDVIYAVDPHFQKEHGAQLSTAKIGIGSMGTLFILKGPGVKQGVEIERTVWLTDIVPTLCYLAELPVPKQCEGSIVYQALADPDAQVKELQSLRRNVERLKRMVERPPMC
ncbi:MAG: alkaline phosphatase family protein [Dehalococcoidales bacterium]|nr:alkaline phosphatase family protein [Dehalococcoidales bacterium]